MAQFELGKLVLTNEVEALQEEQPFFGGHVTTALARYIGGDWGDIDEEEAEFNRIAIGPNADSIFAVYGHPNHPDWKICITTEADRSETTIQFPDEREGGGMEQKEQAKNITVLYCRTAQPDPAAIATQRETLLRYAVGRGFEAVEVFEDDGYSARNASRPAFTRINALIACGRVARILALDVARLGRNTTDVLSWVRTARDMGAEVITLDMEPSTLPRRFTAWLASQRPDPFFYQEFNMHYTIVRVPKTADFDYLYCQKNYSEQGIRRGENFEYAGIYCKRDAGIYDAQYDIRSLGELEGMLRGGAGRLMNRLEADMRPVVEAIVDNDRGKLEATELDQYQAQRLAQFSGQSAATAARRAYLCGEDGSFPYRCEYSPPQWTEESLLDYILDPAQYVQWEAEGYLHGHAEDALLTFLENDVLREEYRLIIENPHHRAHYIKRIIDAATTTAAKSFRVTIRRDGTELTFKADANQFRHDCEYSYQMYNSPAAERQKFERAFDSRGVYHPEEILRIEYGRSVIYQAEGVSA